MLYFISSESLRESFVFFQSVALYSWQDKASYSMCVVCSVAIETAIVLKGFAFLIMKLFCYMNALMSDTLTLSSGTWK